MLNGTKIRGSSQLVQTSNTLSFHVFLDDIGCMGACLIIHQNEPITNCTSIQPYTHPDTAGQSMSLYRGQWGQYIHPSWFHPRPLLIRQHSSLVLQCLLMEPFPWPSPYSSTPICLVQAVPWFAGEEDRPSVHPTPTHMIHGRIITEPAVVSRQRDPYTWSS
jgi:hypothetical protein